MYPSQSWQDLGLSPDALKLIAQAGYASPSPIQWQTIGISMSGRDLIASAQTGSGKTAAFVLPMVERFAGRSGTYGLILAPTREIALQIQATIEIFGHPRGVKSIALIGGVPLTQDAIAIQSYPQIIVATPGRLCDHLERGNVWLDYIQMLVLDEADRMLDMGFADQLARIHDDLPDEHQTMLFSATIAPSVERLAQRMLRNPARIAIGRPATAVPTIDQRLVWLEPEDKMRELSKVLRREPGTVIVFTRTKDGATQVFRSLHSRGHYDVTYIHSDRPQKDRELALTEFKAGTYRVLIATDVAGRGIHVEGVAHVVNYDIPLEPEDYVHRIGRTGRVGASGRATSFATRRDRPLVAAIERLLGKPIPTGDEPRRAGSARASVARVSSGSGGVAPVSGERPPRAPHRPPPGAVPRQPYTPPPQYPFPPAQPQPQPMPRSQRQSQPRMQPQVQPQPVPRVRNRPAPYPPPPASTYGSPPPIQRRGPVSRPPVPSKYSDPNRPIRYDDILPPMPVEGEGEGMEPGSRPEPSSSGARGGRGRRGRRGGSGGRGRRR